jgi:hypothetical protein
MVCDLKRFSSPSNSELRETAAVPYREFLRPLFLVRAPEEGVSRIIELVIEELAPRFLLPTSGDIGD